MAAGTLSVFAFAWMIPGAHAFTGAAVGYGVLIFLLCAGVFAGGCTLVLWVTPVVVIVPVWAMGKMLLQRAAGRMPCFRGKGRYGSRKSL